MAVKPAAARSSGCCMARCIVDAAEAVSARENIGIRPGSSGPRPLALDIQADQNAVFPVHVRNVGLRIVVDVCMLGLAPVVSADLAEASLFELCFERLEIEQIVVDVVEVIL